MKKLFYFGIILFVGITVNGQSKAYDWNRLESLSASQESWHSWRTFQPATMRY